MQVSKDGIKFICLEEGFRDKPYNDIAGHATIGFGRLLHHGPCTQDDYMQYQDGVTKEEEMDLMKVTLDRFTTAVLANVEISLKQHELDGLVSLVYNIGTGAFTSSTVLRMINERKGYPEVGTAWRMWTKAVNPKTGKKEDAPGLVSRRDREFIIYSQGKYIFKGE